MRIISMAKKEGILVVNKPGGMTSHDVVDFVRRRLKTRRVGHAGTLDPIATGVLLVLVGRCTKLFNHFLSLDKEYIATLTLGARTTSGDREISSSFNNSSASSNTIKCTTTSGDLEIKTYSK